MRAVVAHPPGANVRELRQALLGAGYRCLAEDCVEWDDLPPRVARGDADLLVVQTDQNSQANWAALREAVQMSGASAIAVGTTQADSQATARDSGVTAFVDSEHLHEGLEEALSTMQQQPARTPPGMLIAVTAPLPGCGCTTVALNLAGALSLVHPQEAAFIELAPVGSHAADWLGIVPDHPVESLLERHHRLDAASLKAVYTRHAQGLNLLLNSPDAEGNCRLEPGAIKRLSVLARVASRYTVLAVERPESEAGLAALRMADVVLLVTRGDVPAVKRTRRVLGGLTAAGLSADRVRIVLNRDGQAGQLSTAQLESGLGRPIQHRIPDDTSRVNRAKNFGQLVVESRRSRLARSFLKLATELAGDAKGGTWWPFA